MDRIYSTRFIGNNGVSVTHHWAVTWQTCYQSDKSHSLESENKIVKILRHHTLENEVHSMLEYLDFCFEKDNAFSIRTIDAIFLTDSHLLTQALYGGCKFRRLVLSVLCGYAYAFDNCFLSGNLNKTEHSEDYFRNIVRTTWQTLTVYLDSVQVSQHG